MTIDVVVVMASDTYADSVRRGFYSTADQTILSLLESERVRRVLVADQPRDLLSQVARRLKGDKPAPRSPRLRGVRPLVADTSPPTSTPRLHARYRRYDRAIATASRWHGLHKPAVISFNAHYSAHAETRWARSHIFYAQDDALELPRLAPWRDALRTAYDVITSRDIAVVTVTRELASRIGPPEAALVIPNGVDPRLWMDLPPRSRHDRRRPLARYFGTIDSRLDEVAFAQLAQEFDVVVTGPPADADVTRRISAMPGVEVTASLGRSAVVTKLRNADLAILAHRSTPLTEAMSPLKYFEYVASGTPVIASALAGVKEVAEPGQLVAPGGDYLAAGRLAVNRGPLSEPIRQESVREMSWRTRHEALLDILGP